MSAAALVIAACASSGSTSALGRAKVLYDSLQGAGATTRERVQGELDTARAAIQAADSAVEHRFGEDYENSLAHIALRRTQTAEAMAARAVAAHEADSLRAERLARLAALGQAQRDSLAAHHALSPREIDALRARGLLGGQGARTGASDEMRDAMERLRTLVVEITDVQSTERGLVITLSDLLFDLNGSTLRAGAEQNLRRIAAVLERDPARDIAVEGHTGAIGPAEENQRLSEARAAAVRDALVAGGVDSARVTVRGFGETRPLADDDTPEGRARNSRVEIVVLDAGASRGP
ncbi:MAG TPA: OmpA family protein [Gemmatimonadaceae bacterium]|nr:OmpA family protein [Gemmatimonadaceae bacterium]